MAYIQHLGDTAPATPPAPGALPIIAAAGLMVLVGAMMFIHPKRKAR